jgi:hypothetical protein
VAVTIDGETPKAVRVISATEIQVLMPTFVGDSSQEFFAAVDIVVTNLDDSGVAIGGETATLTEGYTYKRPEGRLPKGDPPFLQVLNAFLRLLKRAVVGKVGWVTHTDYGEDGEVVTVVQEHPTISVRCSMPRDKEYGKWDNEHVLKSTGAGTWDRYRPPKTYMMVFDLILSAKNPIETQHLVSDVQQLWQVNQELDVPGDPNWDPSITNNYPLEMPGEPVQASNPNQANVTAFACQLRVRGIPVFADEPVEQITAISTIYMAMSNMTGSTFSTAEIS